MSFMNSKFRLAVTLLVVAVTLWLCVAIVRIVPPFIISMWVARESVPYQTVPRAETMLIVGDSTAYGIGAYMPEESTAGRVSRALDLGAENNARSGALTREVYLQLKRAREPQYELILIQVGANDVMKFTSLDAAAHEMDSILTLATSLSERVVLLTAGDIGAAPLWPWLLGDIYTRRTELLREKFMSLAEVHGTVYVDLYTLPDPFSSDIARYYTPDTIHPSSEGYAVWARYIEEAVRDRWPDWYASRK
jgi:lysophospholipase L1-like esterase